jgi:hypothetical protein
MAQPILPIDKTFRMPVKLVSTDGNELPFEGFMLVPEERLVLLENVAKAAQNLIARHTEQMQDANKIGKVEGALKALDKSVSELGRAWDIPL